MKFLLNITCALFISSLVAAQDFRGENRVFLKLETISDGPLEYESNKFTVDINQELNQITFFVDMQTFKPVDNSASMTLFNDVFQEEFHPDITYKADFSTLKFDAQTDRPQQIDLNGTLTIGTSKVDMPFRVELEQMDRFLFLDFDLTTQLSKMGIDIPEAYRKKISGKMHIQVLNAKLTEGFK
ncbi:MAG: hypothetical protein JWO58_1379 [Chitinophagaceae bacterium]|nr:hypothetical protein [Chitinophagaceae bacterium]